MNRICLISDRNIYMKRLCKFLINQGFEVALVCRHSFGIPESDFPESLLFFQLSSTSFFKKKREINNIIDNFKPDIVHVHYLARDALIPALKRHRKFRYFISIWGSDLNLKSRNYLSRVIQLLALIICDKVHINNSAYRSRIKSTYRYWNNRKFISISWGINSHFFENLSNETASALKRDLNINQDDIIILSHRNHKQLYNHHTLINAIPKVVADHPNAKFIFTKGSCDPAYLEQSKKLVKQLSVSTHFLFIDRWLTDQEIHALLNISDISINIPFMDGLPASLFEIMSTKAVPIVSNLKNYHDFFKNQINGFYLNDLDDKNELSALILKGLNNVSKYQKQFSSINNAYVKEYQNWDTQKNKFLDFYQN
jgi:glycosyltransferase involved in cell wall biosynthesis